MSTERCTMFEKDLKIPLSGEGEGMSIKSGVGVFTLGAVLLSACAAEAPEDEGAMEEVAAAVAGPATVRIVSPADGSEVVGPDVHIVFEVTGLQIAPAGTMDAGSGHHHIFLDTEVTPVGQPVPMETPGIVHLGQAQTEHHLSGVAPGEHRIISVIADGAHIPLNPLVVDTVVFTVTAP
jgi:hypothetical protein